LNEIEHFSKVSLSHLACVLPSNSLTDKYARTLSVNKKFRRKTMNKFRTKWSGLLNDSRGFTLIEMAIVLIIIGIIIGAVMKGKDLIRSAEQKKLYNKFLNAWELSYTLYYDRTGTILGDTATNDNSGVRNGRIANGVTPSQIENQLEAVGLEYPSAGPTGSSNVRRYTTATGDQYNITIRFRNRSDNVSTNYNCIEIITMPTDLGIAFDRMKDDVMDGLLGDIVALQANGGPRIVWPNIDPSNSATFTINRARLILPF